MIKYIKPNSKEHKEYEDKSKEQQARHMCTADRVHECIECGSEDIYCDPDSPEDFYVGGSFSMGRECNSCGTNWAEYYDSVLASIVVEVGSGKEQVTK